MRAALSGVTSRGRCLLAAGFALAVTGEPNSTFSNVMYAPLFVQEMVLAFWLILRGFNARSLPSQMRSGLR